MRGTGGVAVLNAAVLLAGVVTVLTTGENAPSPTARPTATARPTTRPTASPTPAPRAAKRPRPPARLLFTRQTNRTGADGQPVSAPLQVRAVLPDGTVTSSNAPPFPVSSVSPSGRVVVVSNTLSSESHDYYGCGVAGCTSGTYGSTEAGIAVATPKGKIGKQLTKGGYDTAPSFSPDGLQIAYLSHRKRTDGSPYDVVVVRDMYSGAESVLTPPGASDGPPVWSPRGDSVATNRVRGRTSALYRVPVDGGPAVRLAGGAWFQLAWSHHGGTIVGVQGRQTSGPPNPRTSYNLFAVSSAGGPVRQVTHFRTPTASTFGLKGCERYGGLTGSVAEPAFSPDDRALAFLANYPRILDAQDAVTLMAIRVDGTHLRTVVSPGPSSCGDPPGPREVLHILGWV